MNLSGYEAFERSLSDWVDVRNLVTYNQVLYCVPITVFAGAISINRENFRQAGLPVPEEPYRWAQIFELANQLAPDAKSQGDFIFLHEVELAVRTFLKQYMSMRDNASAIDFQTPEFGRPAEAYKSLVERGLVADWTSYDLVDRALLACGSADAPNIWNATPFDPLPMIGEGGRFAVVHGSVG